MNKYLIVLLSLFCFSCVTSGDLRMLADSQQAFESRVDLIMQQTGKTNTEKMNEVFEANEQRIDETEEILKIVEQRTKNTVGAFTGITGNPLLEIIAALGLTAYGTYAQVNRARDTKRMQRGEPVVTPDRIARP